MRLPFVAGLPNCNGQSSNAFFAALRKLLHLFSLLQKFHKTPCTSTSVKLGVREQTFKGHPASSLIFKQREAPNQTYRVVPVVTALPSFPYVQEANGSCLAFCTLYSSLWSSSKHKSAMKPLGAQFLTPRCCERLALALTRITTKPYWASQKCDFKFRLSNVPCGRSRKEPQRLWLWTNKIIKVFLNCHICTFTFASYFVRYSFTFFSFRIIITFAPNDCRAHY